MKKIIPDIGLRPAGDQTSQAYWDSILKSEGLGVIAEPRYTASQEFWDMQANKAGPTPVEPEIQDQIEGVQDKLINLILAQIDTHLSDQAKQIFFLWLNGSYTNSQISDMLGHKSKATVHMSLFGQPYKGRKRGGSIAKIKDTLDQDPDAQGLFDELLRLMAGHGRS